MAFFGLGSAGKKARASTEETAGQIKELAELLRGAGSDDLKLSQDVRNKFLAVLEQLDEDYGSAADIKGLGEELLPTGQAGANRKARSANLRSLLSALPKGSDIYKQLAQLTDEQGNLIEQVDQRTLSEIGDTYGRKSRLTDALHEDSVRNIGDSFGAAEAHTSSNLNRILGDITGTYGKLGKDLDETYSKADTLLSRLAPNSQARAARVSRSFAPAIASAGLRARRAGLTQGSPEYNSLVQGAEVGRSRQMDDTFADENERFTDRATTLALSKFRDKLGLGEGELDRSSSTRGKLGDILTQLSLGKGEAFRGQLDKYGTTRRGMDDDRLAQILDSVNNKFGRTSDYLNDRKKTELLLRSLGVEDLGFEESQADRENADDEFDINLILKQLGLGTETRQNQLNQNQRRIGNYGSAYDTVAGQANQRLNQALGGFQSTADLYQNIFNQESANSGWGAKLLGGVAGSALGAFAGGIPGLPKGASTTRTPSPAGIVNPNTPFTKRLPDVRFY